MADAPDIDRELQLLQSELRRLEAEYNMYFGGRTPRPPVETRRRVQTMVRQLDRRSISNYAARFRFTTLQSRFQTLCDLWDRSMRSREEGRAQGSRRPAPASAERAERAGEPGAVAFRDPSRELDKLRALHERLTRARQEAGEPTIPFHEFAAQVQKEVRERQNGHSKAVALRVTVTDGTVGLTVGDVGEGEER